MARWILLAAAAGVFGIGVYMVAAGNSQTIGGGSTIAASLMFVAAAIVAGRRNHTKIKQHEG
jgi:hypothetical protein